MNYLEQELTPLQRLVFAYARGADRELYRAIFALDNRCAAILRATNETMLGQMRLAWWRDVMAKPVDERPKGDPVLTALAALEAGGLDLKILVPVVNAWELLLVSEELTMEQVDEYAAQRGTVFTVIAGQIAPEMNHDVISKAAELWAKWDLARHASDDAMQDKLIENLTGERAYLKSCKLPKALRPLTILLRLAYKDTQKGYANKPIMRPASAATIIWHGVTGL